MKNRKREERDNGGSERRGKGKKKTLERKGKNRGEKAIR